MIRNWRLTNSTWAGRGAETDKLIVVAGRRRRRRPDRWNTPAGARTHPRRQRRRVTGRLPAAGDGEHLGAEGGLGLAEAVAAEEVEDGVGFGVGVERGSRRHDRRRWWGWSPCQSGEREWGFNVSKVSSSQPLFPFFSFPRNLRWLLGFFFFLKKGCL